MHGRDAHTNTPRHKYIPACSSHCLTRTWHQTPPHSHSSPGHASWQARRHLVLLTLVRARDPAPRARHPRRYLRPGVCLPDGGAPVVGRGGTRQKLKLRCSCVAAVLQLCCSCVAAVLQLCYRSPGHSSDAMLKHYA
jgi:hypothetical protein